jgi:four helix bundle protein
LNAKGITEDYQLVAVGGAAGGTELGLGEKRCGWTGRRLAKWGMADFKKLHVWHKAHALALSVDRVSKTIRATQYLSLRNQIFRAALSIPANIAEGRRKTSEREFARFLGIAVASSSELESHLIFARDAKIIGEEEFVALVSQTIEVRKMLYALIKCLSSSEPPAAPPKAISW